MEQILKAINKIQDRYNLTFENGDIVTYWPESMGSPLPDIKPGDRLRMRVRENNGYLNAASIPQVVKDTRKPLVGYDEGNKRLEASLHDKGYVKAWYDHIDSGRLTAWSWMQMNDVLRYPHKKIGHFEYAVKFSMSKPWASAFDNELQHY